MSTYSNGTTSVDTSPTLICTVPEENDGVLIQNNGSVAVFLGGPSVSTTGEDQGLSLAAGSVLSVPSVGDSPHDLYGIVESTSADVSWLMLLA
jgi:hypothetical protein